MENCYQGINLPDPIPTLLIPCDGEQKSTDCIISPAISVLDLDVPSTQTEVNTNIANALLQKEAQILNLTQDIAAFNSRKVYRGTFLGSTLDAVEDTINDVSINNTGVGVYELLSGSFTTSTNIFITPNGIAAGYTDVTITYDYTDAETGKITFLIKNNGVLVDLLESPIKIEI